MPRCRGEIPLIRRRFLASTLTLLFVAVPFAPLVGASTEPTPNGDVIINGAFDDTTPRGHAQKFYCMPCGENAFVAYDWTAPAMYADNVSVVGDGIRVPYKPGETHFIQQHFAGTDGPDRVMQVFRLALTGVATSDTSSKLRVELRADVDDDGSVESYSARVTLLSSSTTTTLAAGDLKNGLVSFPAGAAVPVRSLRIWVEGPGDALLSRVSMYATNGVEERNLHILPAGDDLVSPLDGVALLNPGDDGQYSFLVGMAGDTGEFLPTTDAYVCLYDASQAIADRGFPANAPIACEHAYLRPDSPAIRKTRAGDAFRFDIAASAVKVPAGELPAFALYATVKVDGSYDLETPHATSEWKSGYFHLGRIAADAANVGAAKEFFGPTPLLIDADADGRPDFVQTQETDGHSVIITPRHATETPLAAIMTTDIHANYVFDVQVYKYDGATGAPMDMLGGIAFGLFDAQSAVSGGSLQVTDFFRAGPEHLSRVDAQTWRVTIPSSEITTAGPIGAWAFHNVGQPEQTNAFGSSTSSTDFYSGIRNSVKDSAVADGMRTLMTPILLDAGSITRDATFVIRLDADADDITALDGTLVLGDKGDGSVTLEYAMVVPDGTLIPTRSHGVALYDAAGAASDDFAPGPSRMEHAEWTGTGVLQPDGWFRIDVPLSAFSEAKGAVGAWGWTDTTAGDGTVVSRNGWYNVLKPAIASLSTSAAQHALYAPTPIVLLDEQLGIPRTLASALAGAGSDLISVTNPLVNPGFEADIFIEGRRDASDNTGGTMTAPPWFLRLDDMGATQPTDPRSTHSVVAGKGRLGDNALKVAYSRLDSGKSLMLGQILGSEQGGDALVWRGASGVAFDVYPVGSTDLTFTAVLRYALPDGTVTSADATQAYTPQGSWGRVQMPLGVPADARLLGFYLVMDAPKTTTFYLDSIVLQGAKTALGDSRSDVTDGYAVVITPEAMAGATQRLVQGADGLYYLYTVEVVDYTQGSPRALDLGSLGRSFALRTHELQKSGGVLLEMRGRTDAFAALVAADDVPAQMAVPWAFVDAGPAYATLGSSIVNQPASGHYNPLKNALAGMPLADQLDYAATPVVFGSDVGATRIAQQALRLTAVAGGYAVVVEADSDFVEETTLLVSAPGEADRSFAVPLASAGGDVVPGLVLTEDELARVTLTTADTRFTRGAQLVAGSPIAQFEVCRPVDPDTCLDVGILTGEALAFRSTSLSPTGEPLAHVWTFGDGRVSTETDTETTHTYTRPGVVEATLTVQTPSGKRATYDRALTIHNQAPVVAGIDVTPTTVFVDSSVRLRARASDADGGTLAYAWSIDGIQVPGATQPSLLLTPEVLESTTGVAGLQKRAYAIGVSVSDGQGGLTSGAGGFTVVDRPATLTAPSFEVQEWGGDYALPGDTLRLSVAFADADDVPARVDVEYVDPAAGAMTLALASQGDGTWQGDLVAAGVGSIDAVATAYAVDGWPLATSPVGSFEVRANQPPVVTLSGPDVVDAGAVATYVVSAVDPEGRAVGGFTLTGADAVGEMGDAFEVRFDDVGERKLVATASDAQGASAATELDVLVDDAIFVAAEIMHTPTAANEGYLVRLTVTDVNGAPVGGASLVVEDFYAGIPAAVDTQRLTTDADGTKVVRLRPEGVLVGFPVSRTMVATATAGSLPDAPVQDAEQAQTRLALRNPAGPLAGLPLP